MGTYVPFYLMYYVLMALQIQFAQTAIGITRRYRRLNTALRNIFAISKNLRFDYLSLLMIHEEFPALSRISETPNETISNLSTKNKVIVQPMKSPNNTKLPRTQVSVASTKSTDKLATISHAPSDENHVMPLPFEARESIVSVPSPSYG